MLAIRSLVVDSKTERRDYESESTEDCETGLLAPGNFENKWLETNALSMERADGFEPTTC
jgi:hypothetical protein